MIAFKTWPADHFLRSEFSCKCGCGYNTVDAELLSILDQLRKYYGRPIKINSGCRCDSHNKSILGKPNSLHLLGKAADIVVSGVYPADVYSLLNSSFTSKYGIGSYENFTHFDVRNGFARW